MTNPREALAWYAQKEQEDMEKNLKPCPFCGGTGQIIHTDLKSNKECWIYEDTAQAFVQCKCCKACGELVEIEFKQHGRFAIEHNEAVNTAIKKAIEAWNRRL